jgi:hypothetical protein
MEWSTTNQKHKSKLATRLDHEEHKLNKATENENCGSKVYRTTKSVKFFLAFSVELVRKTKTNENTHDNTSRVT